MKDDDLEGLKRIEQNTTLERCLSNEILLDSNQFYQVDEIRNDTSNLVDSSIDLPDYSSINGEEDGTNHLENAVDGSENAVDDSENAVDDSEDAIWLQEHRLSLESLPWWKRPSVLSISIVIGLLGLASALAVPSKMSLFNKLACNSLANEQGYCDPVETQELFATFVLYNDVVSNVISLIALTKLGEFSDKFGRKRFFMATSLALLIAEFVRFYAITNFNYLNFALLFLASIIGSLFGGLAACLAFANAYVSDIVKPSERISAIGLVTSAGPIGLLLGSFCSKIMLAIYKPKSQSMDSTVPPNLGYSEELKPLIFEIGLLSILSLYCIVSLPESRSKNAMAKSRRYSILTPTQTSFKDYLLRIVNIFKPLILLGLPSKLITYTKNHLRIRISFVMLIAINLLFTIMGTTISQILIQYGLFKFHWDAEALSNVIILASVSSIVALTVLLPFISNFLLRKVICLLPLKRQLDLIDLYIVLIGFVFAIAGFAAMTTVSGFIIGIVAVCLSGMGDAPMVSAMLKFMPESKTGEFFAARSLLQNICTIIAPILVQNLYLFLVSKGAPTLIFGIYSIITVVFFVLMLVMQRLLRLNRHSTDETLDR